MVKLIINIHVSKKMCKSWKFVLKFTVDFPKAMIKLLFSFKKIKKVKPLLIKTYLSDIWVVRFRGLSRFFDIDYLSKCTTWDNYCFMMGFNDLFLTVLVYSRRFASRFRLELWKTIFLKALTKLLENQKRTGRIEELACLRIFVFSKKTNFFRYFK